VDTLELIDLDALVANEASCRVRPPHHCTVTALYLFKTHCDPSWSRLACEGWKAYVEHAMSTGTLDCASHGLSRHPLDWYIIPA